MKFKSPFYVFAFLFSALFDINLKQLVAAQGQIPSKTVSFCVKGMPFLDVEADALFVSRTEVAKGFIAVSRGRIPLPSEWDDKKMNQIENGPGDIFRFISYDTDKQNSEIEGNGFINTKDLEKHQTEQLASFGVLTESSTKDIDSVLNNGRVDFSFQSYPEIFVDGVVLREGVDPESEAFKKDMSKFRQPTLEEIKKEVVLVTENSLKGDFEIDQSTCYNVSEILYRVLPKNFGRREVSISDLLSRDDVYISKSLYSKSDLLSAILFSSDIKISLIGNIVHFSPNMYVRQMRELESDTAFSTEKRWLQLTPFVDALKSGRIKSDSDVDKSLITSPRLIRYEDLNEQQKRIVLRFSSFSEEKINSLKGLKEVFFSPTLVLRATDLSNKNNFIGFGTGLPISYAWARGKNK